LSFIRETDVTDRVKWVSLDPSTAFVSKGVVIPKRLGRTRAECELQGFVASVEINVEQLVSGQKTVYFQGLRRLQQIRFDRNDRMFISNQSASVYALDKGGAFEEVVRLSSNARVPPIIDCLALDANQNLYLNDIVRQTAFKFAWNGNEFVQPIEIGTTVNGPKKSIAIDQSGEIFIAVMGPPGQGWVIRRTKDGKESAFPTLGTAIWLTAGPDGNLYVPINDRSSILVYRSDGTLVEEIPYNVSNDSPCDIAIDSGGTIYLAFFRTGRILRISYQDPLWHTEFLQYTFATPGGIAIDSRKRLYVSEFGGDSIHVIY
jgi:DNA-binding beta-propeller fold protein YncE